MDQTKRIIKNVQKALEKLCENDSRKSMYFDSSVIYNYGRNYIWHKKSRKEYGSLRASEIGAYLDNRKNPVYF